MDSADEQDDADATVVVGERTVGESHRVSLPVGRHGIEVGDVLDVTITLKRDESVSFTDSRPVTTDGRVSIPRWRHDVVEPGDSVVVEVSPNA